MHHTNGENVASYILGAAFSIYTFLQVDSHEFIQMAPWKLLMTMSVGVVGGVAGVIGKYLTQWAIKKFKRK